MNNSLQNQNVIHQFKVPFILNVVPIIYIILGLFGLLIISILQDFLSKAVGIFLIYLAIKGFMKLMNNLNTTINILNNKNISIYSGFLYKQKLDIPLEKSDGILVHQSIIGRIFNFGELVISTGGYYSSNIINKPNEFRNIILKLHSQ